MFRVKDKRSLKPQLSFSSSVVIFYRTVGLLLLTRYSEGQFKVVGPPEPIATIAGDDIILPCHLNPAKEAVSMTVEWTRPDLTPRYVHVRRGSEDLLVGQNLMYEGRTSMFINKLKHGDTSLRLSNVKLSDAGKYRCFFPDYNRDAFVELVVGVVSPPAIVGIDRSSTGLVLQCESKGWYPEPEVSWLDAEGNLLSAGPTETVRGPDDLYTVSSRVTVEKRHSNSFTCRVQQKNIKQTRETEIQILEDVFTAPSSSAVRISMVLSVVGFLLCSAAFVVCCKLRNNKRHNKMHHDNEPEDGTAETDELVEEPKKMEDQLKEKLKEKEEEQNDIRYLISVLEEKKKELENSRDELKSQIEEVAKKMKKNEKELNSLNNSFRWDKDDKVNELLEVKQELDNKKTDCEKSLLSTEETLQETESEIKRLTERKNKVEKQVEEMKKQLEETKRRRDEIQPQSAKLEREEGKNTESSPLTEGH